MSTLQLLKRGVTLLRSGDYGTPLRWAAENFTTIDTYGPKVADEHGSPPSWVDAAGVSVVDLGRSTPKKDFLFTLDGLEEGIDISPPKPSKTLEFSLIRPPGVTTITLEVTTSHESGKSLIETFRFKDGEFNTRHLIPVGFEFAEPVDSTHIQLSSFQRKTDGIGASIRDALATQTDPRISLPSASPTERGSPPIVLIAIDTFRHDFLDEFQPVLDVLGDDAYVPEEPRTQGHWTRPSHASLLTGTHTAEHGYVVGDADGTPVRCINPSLTTLPEFLTERQYTCSGLVTTGSINGRFGFGRGMHRFRTEQMEWQEREFDASSAINTAIRWLTSDSKVDVRLPFYFIHLFDPHFPYIPPLPIRDQMDLNFSLPGKFRDRRPSRDYLEVLHGESTEVPNGEREQLLEYYEHSLRYTAQQVSRFIKELKEVGWYEDAFIAIVGDHGEEFFERKFALHETLNDANIRPGAIVKLPADTSFDVPDVADYVDIFPTVAQLLGEEPPQQCQGVPWQRPTDRSVRVTERLRPDWYSVAVEEDGIKGIFTWDENFPSLPSPATIEAGTVEEEYYDVQATRDGHMRDVSDELSAETKQNLRSVAKSFATRDVADHRSRTNHRDVSNEVSERLERLGYT